MKRLKKLLAFALGIGMCFSIAGCGNKTPQEAGNRTLIQYLAIYDSNSNDPLHELVDTYNEGQGKEDGVYVQAKWVSGDYGNYGQLLASKRSQYDVVSIADADGKFKVYAIKDYLLPLDDYLTEDIKAELSWDQIPENLINRFRLNASKNSDDKYEAGEGTKLLGLPLGNNPQVLYYNKEQMNSLNINIISVGEDALAEYNSANQGILQPHGYAEYKECPFAGAKVSQNAAGQMVYKVFNDRIAMDWTEYRCLARYLQQGTSATYGINSEWWFYYGFSIGADCIGWNNDTKNYEMAMGDKRPNYLVLKDTKINDVSYSAGDVVFYEDKGAVTQGMVNDTVYALPSNYDMYVEFCRMVGEKTREIDDGKYGYGIADTAQDRAGNFLASKTSMMVNAYSVGNSMMASTLNGKWEYAPTCVYKEFVGGDRSYTDKGDEYLKVIGEEYNDEVYTGALKVINDTTIVGRTGGASASTALCIPRNCDPNHYDAAFKFIKFAAGPEGQTILAKGNTVLPNQLDIGMSDKFSSDGARISKNAYAAALVCTDADLGDYSYFQTKTWVNTWADVFNKQVRVVDSGRTPLKYSEYVKNTEYLKADSMLAQMTIRIYGR